REPGQPLAAVGAAEEGRPLVTYQRQAAAGEEGRPTGETCPVLLAVAGGEPLDAAAVWKGAPNDRGVFIASGTSKPWIRADWGDAGDSESAVCDAPDTRHGGVSFAWA